MTHTSTSALKVKIGEVYSFTNKYNYTTAIKVARITDKSIFVYVMLSDGNFSTRESREGVTEFSKYTIIS